MKKILSLVAIVALTTALAACGNDTNKNNSAANNSAATNNSATNSASNSATTPETKEFTIKATNFEFDQKELTVNKGDTVKITLVNDSGMHGLEIPDYDVNVKGGETVEFVADQAGTFDFHCSVMCGSGHASMTGKLIVQ